MLCRDLTCPSPPLTPPPHTTSPPHTTTHTPSPPPHTLPSPRTHLVFNHLLQMLDSLFLLWEIRQVGRSEEDLEYKEQIQSQHSSAVNEPRCMKKMIEGSHMHLSVVVNPTIDSRIYNATKDHGQRLQVEGHVLQTRRGQGSYLLVLVLHCLDGQLKGTDFHLDGGGGAEHIHSQTASASSTCYIPSRPTTSSSQSYHHTSPRFSPTPPHSQPRSV